MAITPVRIGQLEYLTAEGIAVPHCFTTRLGGVSTGYLASMNIGGHRGDDPACVVKNVQVLGDTLGFRVEDLVLTKQTHSDIVLSVDRGDAGKGLDHDAYPESDALITNAPGVGLMVFTADCTPILLYDPATGAVGAVHAGWRGTAKGIAARTVEAMAAEYGCNRRNVRAAIGPNIGPCCFETDEDVPNAMISALGEAARTYIRQNGRKYYVNLKALNALVLQQAGVEHIEISPLCTACRQDLFWSHRRAGQRRGSQGAIILCKEGEA